MTVYADVLIVINLFVNYALLLSASMILKNYASKTRILLGAAVGSIYGLVIFLPQLPDYAEFFLRLGAAAVIVLCAFGFKNIKYFMRCFFAFFGVSIGFGGLMLLLWVTVAPVGMVYNNGAVYFDINLTVLAISTIVSFAAISVISHFTEKKAPKNSLAFITVSYNGKSVKGKALTDTGNSLRESFSAFPVAVGEYTSLQKIIPKELKACLSKENIPVAGTSCPIRFITHNTVSGKGLLPAFRPDSVEIKTADGTFNTDKIYIAVTKNKLAGGEYDFILNPQILEKENGYAEANGKNKKLFEKI